MVLNLYPHFFGLLFLFIIAIRIFVCPFFDYIYKTIWTDLNTLSHLIQAFIIKIHSDYFPILEYHASLLSLSADVQFQCHFALFRNGAKFLAIIRTLKWMIFYLLNQPTIVPTFPYTTTSTLSTVPISNINSHQIWHFNDGHAITQN